MPKINSRVFGETSPALGVSNLDPTDPSQCSHTWLSWLLF